MAREELLHGTRVIAPRNEGVGLTKPATADRDPDHADPEWFERDLDGDDFKGLDDPDIDPLPTERHRRVPGF